MYKRGHGKVNGQRIPFTDNAVIEGSLGSLGIQSIEDLIHEIYSVGPNFKRVSHFYQFLKSNLETYRTWYVSRKNLKNFFRLTTSCGPSSSLPPLVATDVLTTTSSREVTSETVKTKLTTLSDAWTETASDLFLFLNKSDDDRKYSKYCLLFLYKINHEIQIASIQNHP